MKKFWSILFSAALVLGAAACGDDDNDASADNTGGNGGNGSAFSCMIAVTPGETDAKVSVTVNDAEKAYKVWVVKEADYAQEVPADAVECKGNVTDRVFEGLTPDEDYYAVVWEESMGYKTKDFMTDVATIDYECLKGSDYYLFSVDGTTTAKLGGKVTASLACDDLTTFFDWWNWQGFSATECTGPNFFGVIEGWFSLQVTGADGWFGGCFRLIAPKEEDIAAPGADGTLPEGKISQEAYDTAVARRAALKKVTAEHTLHLAMRSSAAGNYSLGMLDGNTVQIGDENSKYGFARDNQWHEIEIPMSEFMSGETFSFDGVNMLYFTQGEAPMPANLDFDAVFIYKK